MIDKAGLQRVSQKAQQQPNVGQSGKDALLSAVRQLKESTAPRLERLETYRGLLADAKKLPADQQWQVTNAMVSALAYVQADARPLVAERADNWALKLGKAIMNFGGALQDLASADAFQGARPSPHAPKVQAELEHLTRQPSLVEGFAALNDVSRGVGGPLALSLGTHGPDWSNRASLELLGAPAQETGARQPGLPKKTALQLAVGPDTAQLTVREEWAGGARERRFDVKERPDALAKLLDGTNIRSAEHLSALVSDALAAR